MAAFGKQPLWTCILSGHFDGRVYLRGHWQEAEGAPLMVGLVLQKPSPSPRHQGTSPLLLHPAVHPDTAATTETSGSCSFKQISGRWGRNMGSFPSLPSLFGRCWNNLTEAVPENSKEKYFILPNSFGVHRSAVMVPQHENCRSEQPEREMCALKASQSTAVTATNQALSSGHLFPSPQPRPLALCHCVTIFQFLCPF